MISQGLLDVCRGGLIQHPVTGGEHLFVGPGHVCCGICNDGGVILQACMRSFHLSIELRAKFYKFGTFTEVLDTADFLGCRLREFFDALPNFPRATFTRRVEPRWTDLGCATPRLRR